MRRLSFGIISQILRGLSKIETYLEDIIMYEVTLEEYSYNLQTCLEILSDYDLHVRKRKCSFFEEIKEYLGHVVEYNHISKLPVKVRAIQVCHAHLMQMTFEDF